MSTVDAVSVVTATTMILILLIVALCNVRK